MPTALYCDDCGAPAVGLFDITHYVVENGVANRKKVATVVQGRALCEKHRSIRDDTDTTIAPTAPPAKSAPKSS